jgi:hypothetical protein
MLSTITDAVVLDEQLQFRKGKCTVINIFIAQQIIEKIHDFNLETHNSFHHLWKAFDKTDRNNLWNILHEFGYTTHLIEPTKCIYKNNNTHAYIHISGKISEEISKNPEVRQGYSLSLTLLNDKLL